MICQKLYGWAVGRNGSPKIGPCGRIWFVVSIKPNLMSSTVLLPARSKLCKRCIATVVGTYKTVGLTTRRYDVRQFNCTDSG